MILALLKAPLLNAPPTECLPSSNRTKLPTLAFGNDKYLGLIGNNFWAVTNTCSSLLQLGFIPLRVQVHAAR